MGTDKKIYICPVCFRICETERDCHDHHMLECCPGEMGDERRKPVIDENGRIVSRAPRWYLEAVGRKQEH